VLSLAAYSLLAVAALQALLLAYQDSRLRHRQPGFLVRLLPALQDMERWLFLFTGTGFLFLTLSLLSGFLFLPDPFARHLLEKTILSVGAWIVFGVLLLGHLRIGWRGAIAARWTMAGFGLLLGAYLGTKFLVEY